MELFIISFRNRILIILLFFLFISQAFSQVTTRDTLVSWNHFEYTLDENGGLASYSTTTIVEEEYLGLVLENEYVRLVILPEFGARIISYYYKPTSHEQFYTNPVGTPYGMNDGNFYYDWLMVFGGVFPTFPEPEHGKTWFLPWQWEITENSEERISVKMEFQDSTDFPSHPGQFNNGITDIRCIATVTLSKGKTSFDMDVSLENVKNENIDFEYWTCTTLAPGSELGNTFTPGNSEIIAPIDYVYLKDDWWSWMGNAEIPASNLGAHVFEYNNLAIFDNWEDMGIAYAWPSIDNDYYGVINHENKEGVFRIGNNAEITQGMKFWTWGADQGFNADPENFWQVERPYIELWSGLSTQFFEDANISANEIISWKETYLPTIGMESISMVNENGALHLDYNDNEAMFEIDVFTTSPDATFQLYAFLSGEYQIELIDEDFVSVSSENYHLQLSEDQYLINDGNYDFTVQIIDQNEDVLIETSIPVSIYSASGISHSLENKDVHVKRLARNLYELDFVDSKNRLISIYTINGKLIDQNNIYDSSGFIKLDEQGVYIVKIVESAKIYSIKLVIN